MVQNLFMALNLAPENGREHREHVRTRRALMGLLERMFRGFAGGTTAAVTAEDTTGVAGTSITGRSSHWSSACPRSLTDGATSAAA